MRFVQLDSTTWIEPESGMVITDPGPDSSLIVTVNGNPHTVTMPQADVLRARFNHNPTIVPPSPSEHGWVEAGVEFWDGHRTPEQMRAAATMKMDGERGAT